MTYNFDVDRWYARERARLAARRDLGELSDSEFQSALDDLDGRYDEMVQRLDRSYRIPPHRSDTGSSEPS